MQDSEAFGQGTKNSTGAGAGSRVRGCVGGVKWGGRVGGGLDVWVPSSRVWVCLGGVSALIFAPLFGRKALDKPFGGKNHGA